MFKEFENYFLIEEFENYGIKAIFTKKVLGNMGDYVDVENKAKTNRENVLKLLGIDRTIVHAFQKHTNTVKYIDENEKLENLENLEDIDGFITKRKDIAIFTYYADCLPIYILDKKNKAYGIAHSGWQGTYKEMLKSLIEAMKNNFNSLEEDLIIGLGIAISVEDYEVQKDFYDNFVNKFGEIAKEAFLIKENKYYFDNTKLNYLLALNYGILKENIVVDYRGVKKAGVYSHRLDNVIGRSAAIITFGE